jgi:anti-sigma-K factor RskA
LETKDFIESGILESYLLGLTSEDEKEYIQNRILTDQQVTDHVLNLESDIRLFFDQYTTPPPAEVREIVQLRTARRDIQKKKHVFEQKTTQDTSKKDEYLEIEVNDTYIKVHKLWRPAFIAVFILSKIFLIAGLYYYFKTVSLEQENEKLKMEIHNIE